MLPPLATKTPSAPALVKAWQERLSAISGLFDRLAVSMAWIKPVDGGLRGEGEFAWKTD